MTEANNPISAIETLLAERRRYEGWMATLETRRESTPPHVYERVRTDYEARLREVLGRLGGRSSDLRQLVDTLSGKVSNLESDETTRRDALAEAELRALVGEFEPSEWERVKSERDAEIERLRKERDGAREELARIQELLSQADAEPRFATPAPGVVVAGGPAAGKPEAKQAPDTPVPELIAEPPLVREAAQAASAPPPPPPAAPSSFDELAFLQSLSDAGATGAGAAPNAQPPAPARPVAPTAPVADAARALADDLATRPFGTPADQPSQRSTSPAMRQMANPVAEPPRASQPQPQAVEPRRVTDGVPSFLRDVPSEQVKTLKCQECGTMNYPTEWYCERCGGELAAM